MTRKGRRLTLIASALAVIGVAIGLALFAFRDGVVFFVTPSELAAKTAQMRPDARMIATCPSQSPTIGPR